MLYYYQTTPIGEPMTEQEFTQTYLSTFMPQQLAAVKAVEGATLLLAVPPNFDVNTQIG